MSNPEVGMPLNEFLGSDVTVASTGASVCGNVLKACGFNVTEDSGMSQSAPGSDIASLALTNSSSAPRGPSQG